MPCLPHLIHSKTVLLHSQSGVPLLQLQDPFLTTGLFSATSSSKLGKIWLLRPPRLGGEVFTKLPSGSSTPADMAPPLFPQCHVLLRGFCLLCEVSLCSLCAPSLLPPPTSPAPPSILVVSLGSHLLCDFHTVLWVGRLPSQSKGGRRKKKFCSIILSDYFCLIHGAFLLVSLFLNLPWMTISRAQDMSCLLMLEKQRM